PPCPAAAIARPTSRVIRKGPSALTALIRCQCATEPSSSISRCCNPALLTSSQGAPCSATTAAQPPMTEASSVTSIRKAAARCPSAINASARACAAPASMSAMTTFAPASASTSTTPTPMPLAPPVTIASLPSSRNASAIASELLLLDGGGRCFLARTDGVRPDQLRAIVDHRDHPRALGIAGRADDPHRPVGDVLQPLA